MVTLFNYSYQKVKCVEPCENYMRKVLKSVNSKYIIIECKTKKKKKWQTKK